VDLNRVAAFARVVETGSFTAAASALGVRKSSVSRSVAALEADLGIRLLQRTTRRLSLTEAGHAYYDRARDALAGLDEAREAVSSLGTEPRGLVRFTAPVDLADELAPITGQFLREHPRVRVEALLTGRYVDLVKEGFDLAVRAGVLADSSLLARKLGDSDLGLFASPDYLEGRGRPRRVADLAHHDCILYRAGGGKATWRLQGRHGEERVSVQGRVDADELTFVRGMLLAGSGIGFVPVYLFAPLVESGQLERVLPQYAHHGSAIHIVWPSRRFEPAAVSLFRDAIASSLSITLAGDVRRGRADAGGRAR
jgi:DNA-binding transcriptional LysR family regulator